MGAWGRAAFCLLSLLGLIQTPLCVTSGKILIWPGEHSHWLYIKIIIAELIARGHNVTIVTHSASPSVVADQSLGFNMEIVQVPHSKEDVIDLADRILMYWINDLPNTNKIQGFLKLGGLINIMFEQNKVLCKELFAREDLLEKWRKEQFDVLLTDPVILCGELLAQKLNLPLIQSLRFTLGYGAERNCGQMPAPPSYVPGSDPSYTDHMNFLQRVNNFLLIVFQDIMFYVWAKLKWDPLFTEVMGK